jgi:hypothetical protein
LYFDGVLKSKQRAVLIGPTIGALVHIGYDHLIDAFDNRYWIGGLDDVRIYNRILKQSEITYLANNK